MILGAGIYALIGAAAGVTGNSLWISFLLGAFISSFTGLSYAHLAFAILLGVVTQRVLARRRRAAEAAAE